MTKGDNIKSLVNNLRRLRNVVKKNCWNGEDKTVTFPELLAKNKSPLSWIIRFSNTNFA